MMQRSTPLLVGLAAGATLLLRGPVTAGPTSVVAPPTKPTTETSAPIRAGAAANGPLSPSRRYAQLYGEFFGLEPQALATPDLKVSGTFGSQKVSLDFAGAVEPTAREDADLSGIATAVSDRFQLQFMICLISDPIDSRLASDFDLEMTAMQKALADAEYQFDRKSLPWMDEDATERKTFRDTAGLLLYRRNSTEVTRPAASPPPKTQLLAVFLVGESPKLGIQKRAFDSAVRFIIRLHQLTSPAMGPPQRIEIPLLGPAYSGSADSLALAIRQVDEVARFRIVSGSATSNTVGSLLTAGDLAERVRFSRTVMGDQELVEKGLHFLSWSLGWDLEHAALLIENDTAYGSAFLDPTSCSDCRHLQRIVKWSFPSGLFSLRNAWAERGGLTPSAQTGSGEQRAGTGRSALDVTLTDKRPPVDVIPELSQLSARIDDMAIGNSLRQIANEKINYVGILATDVKDEIFLAEEIRHWLPNVTIFVLDSNLLYVHPQYSEVMFGTITLSSFPLAAEGTDDVVSPSFPPRGRCPAKEMRRRQFSSEWQEGVFVAIEMLLGKDTRSPQVWVSASGNESLLPLARIPTAAQSNIVWSTSAEEVGPNQPMPNSPSSSSASDDARWGSCWRVWDIQLLLLVVATCVMSWILLSQGEATAKALPRTRWLLTAAEALLCLPAAAAAALWLIALLTQLADYNDPQERFVAWLFLGALTICYSYLGHNLIRTSASYSSPQWAKRILTSLVVLGIPAFTGVIFDEWSLGSFAILYHRVSAFNSGLSPLVSLAWIGAALLVWLLIEGRRQLLWLKYSATWPLGTDFSPELPDAGLQEHRLPCLIERTLPCGFPGHYAIPLGIVTALGVMLLVKMQPIAESRGYGALFLLLCAGVSALNLCSLLRFFQVWREIRALSQRVALTDLLPALKRTSSDIDWKPLQFRRCTTAFGILRRSLEMIRTRFGNPAGNQGLGTEPPGALDEVIRAAADNPLSVEIEKRNALRNHLELAHRQLEKEPRTAARSDLFALRLAGYLQQAVLQMRCSLMAAMGPGLLVALAVATYGFQPKRFTMLVLWGFMVAVSAATVAVFVQMDRDTTLSAIGGTQAGEVSSGWHLLAHLATYGLWPVVGLVTSQFPSIGSLFNSLLDPLIRILGLGAG